MKPFMTRKTEDPENLKNVFLVGHYITLLPFSGESTLQTFWIGFLI